MTQPLNTNEAIDKIMDKILYVFTGSPIMPKEVTMLDEYKQATQALLQLIKDKEVEARLDQTMQVMAEVNLNIDTDERDLINIRERLIAELQAAQTKPTNTVEGE